MDIAIKKERLSDKAAETIFKIVKQCFVRDFDPPTKDVEVVKEYLKDSEVYFLYFNDLPIGYFGLWHKSNEEVELKSIAVLPEHQGKGMGSKMLEKIFELTRGKKISLVVHPHNTSAIFSYLKNAFMIIDWKENYFGDGKPRLVLEKK